MSDFTENLIINLDPALSFPSFAKAADNLLGFQVGELEHFVGDNCPIYTLK